jgi:CheY-like chemotaxis protein
MLTQCHRPHQHRREVIQSKTTLAALGLIVAGLPLAAETSGGRQFQLPGMRRALGLRHPEGVLMRCMLVDDNQAFLETARGILEGQGVTITGVASSTAEALREASGARPDVAVVDIGLGGENGFDLARYLAEEGISVIMTSTSAEADYADLVAENPVAGFLPKTELSAAGIRRILGA